MLKLHDTQRRLALVPADAAVAPVRRYRGLRRRARADGTVLLARRAAPAAVAERLRRALDEDLFVLHYQPIVSLADGACPTTRRCCASPTSTTGRWSPPGSFLPAAERYGLIRDIDRMVIDKVAALLGGELRAARGARSR